MKKQTLRITHTDMIEALQMYINTIRKDGAVVSDLISSTIPGVATIYDVSLVSGQENFKTILKDGKK